jgi:hypothetical protein
VTVVLTPTVPGTLVFGLPFTFPEPPVAGCPGGCTRARTTITTGGGVVTIDTVVLPLGTPTRFSVPSLAVISIHPPSPCRVQVVGTTVTFTPIAGP